MLSADKLKRVAIVGSNRIPFVRGHGKYINTSNQEMFTAALQGLVDRFDLKGKVLGEVAGGAVLKDSRDFNMVRESVLGTNLNPRTPGVDIQQACDTGLETAIYIANKIALGQIECGIAGGVDNVSDAPLSVKDSLRVKLLAANRGKTTGDKVKALLKIRPSDLGVQPPQNGEPRTGLAMGGHQQIGADYYKIAREDQDALAFESHQKLHKAYEEGFMDDLVSPFKGVERDNILRPSSTMEKLASLKGAFGGGGTMTAANSTSLTDGASTVFLASEEYAKENNLPILAYFKTAQLASVEFVKRKENLLMAPVVAMKEMLEKVNMPLQDFDFYEIHEAFAAQTLATLKVWESEELSQSVFGQSALGKIDRAKLNVKGSSIAAGHPFAATGGRIIGVLAKLLNEKGSGKGVISICAAGGQGLTAILEK